MPARPNLFPFLASAFLLGATLLPAAVQAQQGTGAAITQTRPERRQAATEPGIAESVDDPATLLRLAERTLASGRARNANELLERAEARLLTRSELASEADRPEMGGAIGEIAAARSALAQRDRAEAERRISAALIQLERRRQPMATGPTMAPAPAFGGGPMLKGPEPAAAPAPPPQPLPGIAPQNMPVGGSASPPVPVGPDIEVPRQPPPPGYVPPSSTKPPPL